MRPCGGFTPEMYNYSNETDVYKIWADMICFDESTKPIVNHHYTAFVGRRDEKTYAMVHIAIMVKYGDRMVMQSRIPDALSGAMGNIMYVANLETEEELNEYYKDLLES